MLTRLLLFANLWSATLAFHAAPGQLASRVELSKTAQTFIQINAHSHNDTGASSNINRQDDERIEGRYQHGVSRRAALIAGASLYSLCRFPTDAAYGVSNPSPNVQLNSSDGKPISMPLIAYSFYKTPSEQAPRGLALALRAGVRHFDMATDYANFEVIAPILKKYFNSGKIDWNFNDEKDELIKVLDDTRQAAGNNKKVKGKNQRRQDVFLTYKLSNDEQSTDASSIRRKVNNLLSQLDTPFLDMISLHSPLPGSELRIATYKTLLQLKEEGLIRSVGVCNYGICHLEEIAANNLPLPSVNQLEISPFNTHEKVVQFCRKNNVQVSCGAWSKLSSVSGPVEQWAKLGELAKDKGVTKAQVLVRWALQKGYGCAPRSGTKSKLERIAIAENSYGGVIDLNLSINDMKLLDVLDVNYKTGKLGRRDGWKDEDVTSEDWDPTEVC